MSSILLMVYREHQTAACPKTTGNLIFTVNILPRLNSMVLVMYLFIRIINNNIVNSLCNLFTMNVLSSTFSPLTLSLSPFSSTTLYCSISENSKSQTRLTEMSFSMRSKCNFKIPHDSTSRSYHLFL